MARGVALCLELEGMPEAEDGSGEEVSTDLMIEEDRMRTKFYLSMTPRNFKIPRFDK